MFVGNKMLSELSAESGNEGVKPGEGGDDLARSLNYDVWKDEDAEEDY